ncbi:5391_t:CDS:2, partial [Funneliformis caledonium]
MSFHSFSFTPFLHIEDKYDGVNNFDPSGTSEDTFNLLADNTQSFVLNEKESLNMTFANWKKLDEWLENHELEQGFAFTITHSDKDKDDDFP